MDKRKRGSSLFSFHGRTAGEEGGAGGECEVLEEDEEEDLFGDEDDELFSRISEDSCLIENLQENPQPSTSYGVGRPSPSTQVNNFGRVTPQSRPLEKLQGFDEQAGTTWIYPVNYPLREYQFSMVQKALFQNTLISLPTGLGKTFIAAVLMYNFYRWYPSCKVVFMAPTKPLVAQQVEACFNIMGIPQEDIAQMTGILNREKRSLLWLEKRVFFLTPQVLDNDLSRGTCPAKLIRCLVLDEAHRAQGNHSYCQVVRKLKEHGHDFRILALSATPGSDIAAVRQVLMNLFISHVELRNEDSADLQEHTFQRRIEKVVVPLGEELTNLNIRYLKILRVYVSKLIELKVLHTRDETTLTKFQLLKSRECFRQNTPSSLPRSKLGAVEGLFALCMSLYHAYELMMQHGIRSFYRFLSEMLGSEKGHYFARSELRHNGMFQSLMSDLSKKFEAASGAAHASRQDPSALFSQLGSPKSSSKVTPAAPFIISHPKMAKLLSVVLEHLQKYADENKSTRIMVFSQYRDSVQEITEMLQHHHPLVKAMSFIGHNKTGQSGKGLSQKKQIQVVSKFREGGYNTLVSTCVGEEGLDIGDVDLIICYDAPKSPIRLVQRMGRTGRKREGRIVILLTKGKEEQAYNSSQYQKKAINTALGDTNKLARYLVPSSPRMVPRGLTPSCLKLHMKSESWKTKGKSTPKGRGSLLSMLPKTGSSSKKGSPGGALMSKEEWLWYKNIRVPWQEVKSLPPASLMCLDASKREFDAEKHINLGSFQPWQSLPQTTHLIGHSQQALHLVELSEFILLHQHFGPDEDPYGLEMAAFLDKTYLEGGDGDDQPSPDFKKTLSKNPPAASQENGKMKKTKKTKNSVGGKGKKAKTVQKSLITDMFNRITQSQAKSKQDNNMKKDVISKPSQSSSQINAGNKSNKKSLNNSKNTAGDEGNEVICLENDVDEVQSSCVLKNGSEDERGKQPAGTPETSDRKRPDPIPSMKSSWEKLKSSQEMVFLPMPSGGGSSSLHIEVPPQTMDFGSKEEIEEPDSPSEVLEFCIEWLMKNQKTHTNETEKDSLASHSRDMFELTVTEKHAGARRVRGSTCVSDKDNDFVADDREQLQGNTSVFSTLEVSPVIGKHLSIQSRNTSRSDGRENRWSTDVTGLSNMDVSPVLGRSNTQQSSTPKTVSKRLFKGIAPHLSTIEEFSPIPKNQNSTSVLGDVRCPPSATGKRKKETECQENAGSLSALQQNHRKRFKSKLSRFARPEEPDLEAVEEVSCADKAAGVSDSVLPNGCGKMIPKKLLYEEIPAKSDQFEDLTNKSSSEIIKVKTELTSSFSKSSKSKDTSSFLFEDLNKINVHEENQNLKSVERRQEDDLDVSHSNTSRSVKDSSQPLTTIKREDSQGSRKETASTRSEEQSVHKSVKVETTDTSKVIHEETNGNVSVKMEDSSLFDHIDECEIDPDRATAAVKHEASNSGLTVTQILGFLKGKLNDGTQNTSSNSTFSKPLSNNSNNKTGNLIQTPDHSSRKLSLSLSKRNHQKSKSDGSNECDDIEVIDMSSASLPGGGQRNSLNKGPLNSNSNSSHLPVKQTAEQRPVNESSKEKQVSFCDQQDEFEMSESLFDDEIFELVEMPEINDETGNVKNSSSAHPSWAEGHSPGNRTHKKSKDQSRMKLSRSKQDSGSDSSKLLSPTQLLVIRKRKVYNVVDSDHEESFVSSGTDKDGSKTTTLSDHSRASEESVCMIAPLRKAVAEHLRSELEDDSDFVGGVSHLQPIEGKATKEKRRKKKKKRFDYLDDEAELSKDARFVSSDESEGEEREYDRSFVDDGTYFSQDNDKDMRAVYLRSVVSPVKVNLNHRPPLKYINGSSGSEGDGNEELDSFVVDNSFVEYETEYAGETMFAEDPIMQEALLHTTKKTKDATNGNKAKRKRIVLNESSSDEDTSGKKEKRKRIVLNESSSDEDTGPDSKTVKQSPVKNIPVKNTAHSHPDKPSHLEGHGSNGGSVLSNKNAPSSSKVDPSDNHDFEIIELKSSPPELREDKPSKLSSGKLSLNSNRQQKVPASAVRSLTLSAQETNSSSGARFVKPVINKGTAVVNDQQGVKASGGPPGTSLSPVLPRPSVPPKDGSTRVSPVMPRSSVSPKDGNTRVSPVLPRPSVSPKDGNTRVSPVLPRPSVPPKNDSRKGHDQGLNTSLNTGTRPSPTTSPGAGSQATATVTSQLNTSGGFFVSSVPFNRSLTNSQTVPDTAPQEGVGVLVDHSEVQSGGNLLSHLRLRYGAQTAVVPLKHAHYAISTRMAVARLSLAVFSNSQNRSRLVERVQGMLELYERPVIIVETGTAKGSPSHHQTLGASRYLDTIVCACTQVTRLKLLYSKSQEETSQLLWQLLCQEKTKGFKMPTEPPMNKKRLQMVSFYLTLPSVGYPTAVAFAQNFITIKEFIRSSPECIMKNGSISIQKATTLKQHLSRQFREDMLDT